MKKIFFALSLCIALSATSAQAQSLDALINSLSSFFSSSEEPEKAAPKITHPEAYDLMGRWYFDTLVMDYTGDSSLASVAVSTLETQLPAVATKFNLVAGRDYIDINEDGSTTIVRGEARMLGYCTYYDSYSGDADLTFTIDGKSVHIDATIIEQDVKTKVLFNANKLMSLMQQHYTKFNENTILQTAKTVIDSYPGIRVGATVKR